MSEWISPEDRLPENNTYVLVRYCYGNWHDRDDQERCVIKVMKFKRGLTVAEKKALPHTDLRKGMTNVNDEDGNNRRGYRWDSFGAGSFFGQDVDFWQPIEPPKELNNE